MYSIFSFYGCFNYKGLYKQDNDDKFLKSYNFHNNKDIK